MRLQMFHKVRINNINFQNYGMLFLLFTWHACNMGHGAV